LTLGTGFKVENSALVGNLNSEGLLIDLAEQMLYGGTQPAEALTVALSSVVDRCASCA
jgi:hypothetical protein